MNRRLATFIAAATGLLFSMPSGASLNSFSVSGVRAEVGGAAINPVHVVLDSKTHRMALERFTKTLTEDEKDCVFKQKRILSDALGRAPSSQNAQTYKVAYEVISSKSQSLDHEKLLSDSSITGPFKGLLTYKIRGTSKTSQVLHLPVIVFSDGSCRPFKAEQILGELQSMRSL